jgi:uncharacterized protein
MASTGLLALIDDIATLLDDVALFSKIAAKKTAGVLGDDLALNAEQVSGIRAERELPVVWAVAKGSAKNKLILVPAALLISAVAPWAITPLLMLGGCFLCFEGFEKIAHALSHNHSDEESRHQQKLQALSDPAVNLAAFEKTKIKGAIRTDFILSAEIVVIALGTVQEAAFSTQILVVSLIAAVITVGVYGIVAAIVKLDDAGLYLMKAQGSTVIGRFKRAFGRGVLSFCPYLMKTLSTVGTAAMFLVGGGILVHGIPSLHHLLEYWAKVIGGLSTVAGVISPGIFNAVLGVLAGGLLFVSFLLLEKLRGKTN